MKNTGTSSLNKEGKLADGDMSSIPCQPSCSGAGAGGSQNSPEYASIHSLSTLMQIDCSFIDVTSDDVYNLISSIRSRNLSQYRSSMHVFLESCMSKSLQHLRLFKVEPLISYEKINSDPNPNEDEYIVHNKEEYNSLQYMCDYLKYYMLEENYVEVLPPMDEFIANYIEENECNRIINAVKRETNVEKCSRFRARYGPTVDIPPTGVDKRVLYTRSGHSFKSSIEKLEHDESDSCGKSTINRDLISKFISPGSGKKIISKDSTIRAMKLSSNNYTSSYNWYAQSFVKFHILLSDKFEKAANDKKSLIGRSTYLRNIAKDRERLRNAELKTRDIIIKIFMQYYLSLKNQFKFIFKHIFKDKLDLLNGEFELPPAPEKCSLLKQTTMSDNHRCKIISDMEIVRHRMGNYLSKIEHKHEESEKLYTENAILIRNKCEGYIISLESKEDYDSTHTPLFPSTSLGTNHEIREDKSDTGTNAQSSHLGAMSKPSSKSFNTISGLNASSGIKWVDPGLVDPGSIADIVCSLDNKDVRKYLSAMSIFTAKFMHKSLKYTRALKIALPNYTDTYLNDTRADGYIANNNGNYGRLQYMCDHFKYYVLRSQLDPLAYEEMTVKASISPLLKTINDEEKNFELNVGTKLRAEKVVSLVNYEHDEYNLLIKSIEKEYLNLSKTRKIIIDGINHNKTKIWSLIRPLDLSCRDHLIECLMKYYLSITDRLESIANLEFKNIGRQDLNDRFVLPVSAEIGELVHEEIITELPTFYYIKRKNLFCSENVCMCNYYEGTCMPAIRVRTMEKIVDRMKEYILSLHIKDNGEVTHNSIRLFRQ
ncbi:hypothetical protein [Candidatus Ichthyocystis sparus]|uniref:hypothetical protein n=1 Tax=Candidatus Ichthyocystis sparus TaxID=1561004 RepID=UPI000ACC8E9B|nr:hypothetical protein [Candidatus Ichthyocystis sparus]